MKFIVVTTIHPETTAIAKFREFKDWHTILVGDVKTPPIKSSSCLTYLSIKDQDRLGYELTKHCPSNHYSRKNIGYLYAVKNDAEAIFDTDDDNIPYDDWSDRLKIDDYYVLKSGSRFINVYKLYTHDPTIWPRGLPLHEIHENHPSQLRRKKVEVGVWQGLADIDPDVDALYRLLNRRRITFRRNPPVVLDRGVYSPFNSQNTIWAKRAYSYLYLPMSVGFRSTDILRGYIAQKLLWQDGMYLGFRDATVYQERNPHDLMRDLRDDLYMAERASDIVEALERASLNSDPPLNLRAIYNTLAARGHVAEREMATLECWARNF